MKRKALRTFAVRSFALVIVLGTVWKAQPQDIKAPYPSMAPLDQYLMERNAEIALARSAGVVFVVGRFFENDGRIPRKRFEGFVVVKRKWRGHDANPNLKSTFNAQLGIDTAGEVPEELPDGRVPCLLAADGGITEARGELQRIDAVAVNDSVYVDVPDSSMRMTSPPSSSSPTNSRRFTF